ncbi:hypothetical protein ACHAXT_006924 [Thalassiosira profunda]
MSKPPPAPSLQFSALLGSTLETILHELLHSRSIYPPDSFVLHRHLGVRCHASRVPQVGEYVANFLKVAVPSIVSGDADSLTLVILEEEVAQQRDGGRQVGERTGGTTTVERFVFAFQMANIIGGTEEADLEGKRCSNEPMDIEDLQRQSAISRDAELVSNARSQLESAMRECLLRVLSLRRRRRRKEEKPENMSFKLCLHVREEEKKRSTTSVAVADGEKEQRSADSLCPELAKALKRGEWLQPEQSSCLFTAASEDGAQQHQNKMGSLRPIKDVHLPSCGMSMQFGMYLPPQASSALH